MNAPPPSLDLEAQRRTPLFDAMVDVARRGKVSFHTPGHKGGAGIARRLRDFVGPRAFALDLTILDEVDSLHKPRGVIREAQALAARAFGAERTYFLVNGSTGGNQAMLLATCEPGEPVLVARNAHKSVLNGLMLSGARPVFYSPPMDARYPVPLNVDFDATRRAIEAHPECRVLFLTSPDYRGVCADLPQIVPYAHARGLTVLVDEAHGPHLSFHPALPPAALEVGADLVVQSTHKLLGGMTQASMLHARGERVSEARVARVLRSIQTTSPSYLLLASLDVARMQMATEGRALLSQTIRLAEEARRAIRDIPGLRCPGPGDFSAPGVPLPAVDVTKLPILVEDLGLTGFEVARRLNHGHDIHVEMADPTGVLAIVSIGDRPRTLRRLVDALRAVAAAHPPRPDHPRMTPPPLVATEAPLTPREAVFAASESVLLHEAAGRVASETVTVYPPGVPLIVPGEVVSADVIEYLKRVMRLGATVDGLDESNRWLNVVR